MNKSRRTLLMAMGATAVTLPLAAQVGADTPKLPRYKGKKLGMALVGLGRYATGQIAVGLEKSDYWSVKGIVTGSEWKIPAWKKKWNIENENIFNYENFDQIAKAKDIDVVYICLPNSMHAEFTIRAAKAGKHVIVEKPMATSVKDAEAMIEACNQAGVKLAVGYRLHFNKHHQQIMKWGKEKTHGEIRNLSAGFCINVGDSNQWRLKKSLAGGGSLMDVGIYCVQAARYGLAEEPLSVTAQFGPVTDTEKFREVEDGISWQMKFPSGAYMTGYSAYQNYIDHVTIGAANKTYKIEPAFSYGPLKGEVYFEKNAGLDFPHEHHQYRQMEAMGPLFLSKDPMPDHISGMEGLKDVKILMAIYEAARTGKEVFI
jgi:predicted dehydrogenase